MQIEGLTKKVSFEEAKKAIEENKSIVGIVAVRPLDLLDMNKEEFWDFLEEETVEGFLEKDSMDEELLEYNKEHGVLLYKVEIWARDIEL